MRRRDFLAAPLALGALVATEQRARGEHPEQNSETQDAIVHLMFAQDYEKMEFLKERKKPTEKIFAVVQAMKQYEVATDADPQERPTAQRRLWELLRATMKLPEYSETAFYEVAGRILPRELAKYGILAEPTLGVIAGKVDHKILAYDISWKIFQIDSVATDSVTVNGEEHTRDIIYINDLKHPGLTEQKELYGSAHSISQNSIIHKGLAKKITTEMLAVRGQQLALLEREYTPENLRPQLERTPNSQTQDMLGVRAAEGLLMKAFYTAADSEARFENIERDRIQNHEIGHIIDAKKFKNIAAPPHFNTLEEYDAWWDKAIAESEAYAMLTEVLLSKNKSNPLANFFMNEQAVTGREERGHIQASVWLREAAVKELLADPEIYGIHIQEDSLINPRNQALLQIAQLLEGSRAEVLATRLLERLKNNKGIDLSTVELAAPLPPRPRRVVKDVVREEPRDPSCSSAEWGTVVAVGVALGLVGAARFFKRRDKVRVDEARAMEKKKNTPDRRGKKKR